MKKYITIIFSFLSLFVCLSCSDDDNDTIPEQEPVRYYVKYELSGTTQHINVPRLITVNTEKGNQTIKIEGRNIIWDETYGPVNKIFIPRLDVKIEDYEYSSSMEGKIYVSREKEPFVLKAQGTGKYSLSLTCTIDF